MADASNSVANQIRLNTVALISIIIAVSSLSYNTWRNEKNGREQKSALCFI